MGDIDIRTTIGALVSERPGRSRFFEGLGIDYCSDEDRSLEDVCTERGLYSHAVAAALAVDDSAWDRSFSGNGVDFHGASPAELAEHIVAVNHAFLRRELPRLAELALRVTERHGEREPRLVHVAEVIATLRIDVAAHIESEERGLLSALTGAAPAGWETTPEVIESLEDEHEATAVLLQELRGLTDDYRAPGWGSSGLRALYAGLQELEADIQRHVHMENNFLFPAVGGR